MNGHPPPIVRDRVLVRNRDLLLLYDLTKGIPEDIIETVTPDELDSRGKYEILKCEYNVEGLDANDLRDQIEPLVSGVHRQKLNVIPAANLMIIQETGMNLRKFRTILQLAKSAFGRDKWDIDWVELKHVSPDEILTHVHLLGVSRETLQTEDGQLRLSIDPFGIKILFTGTPERCLPAGRNW